MNLRPLWDCPSADVAHFVFPDNTVLNNFAIVHRMDLLADLVGDRGAWCATVRDECNRGSQKPGLEDMKLAEGIFGKPLYPESAVERLDIQTLVVDLASPGDGPNKHLGEAETIVIVRNRKIAAMFFTDDGGARDAAQRDNLKTYSTWDLLALATRVRKITIDEFWGYAGELHTRQRGWPPCGYSRSAFEAWVRDQ